MVIENGEASGPGKHTGLPGSKTDTMNLLWILLLQGSATEIQSLTMGHCIQPGPGSCNLQLLILPGTRYRELKAWAGKF